MRHIWLTLIVILQVAEVSSELKVYPIHKPHLHDLLTEDAIIFSCIAPNDLTPEQANLRWMKGNGTVLGANYVEIDAGNTKLVYRNSNPTEGDEGIYVCEGVVDGVKQQASIRLQFYYGIKVTSPSEQYVLKDTDAAVECWLEATNEMMTIQWKKLDPDNPSHSIRLQNNDRYQPHSVQKGSELVIQDAQLTDTGTYICQVDIAELGKSIPYEIHLTVTELPSFTHPPLLNPPTPKEGEMLTMTCIASGLPDPKYVFLKIDGGTMVELTGEVEGGEYVMEDVQRTDEGTYRCRGVNKAGDSLSEPTVLNVIIEPVISDQRLRTEETEGNLLRLPCVAAGDPSPAISWRRQESDEIFPSIPSDTEAYVETPTEVVMQDEIELTSVTSHLVFPRLTADDAANYVCHASNSAGEDSKILTVDVRYPPQFKHQLATEFWGWEGSRTNLTCIANGFPRPVITWLRNGREIPTENAPYLLISGVSDDPNKVISYLVPTVDVTSSETVFGEYVCQAENVIRTRFQPIIFSRAVTPGAPIVRVMMNKPTELLLGIAPPENNGGLRVASYRVVWGALNNMADRKEKMERRMPAATTEVHLRNLTPNTKYTIKVYAVNSVGEGAEMNLLNQTDNVSKPDPVRIVSSRSGTDPTSYWLEWVTPMTGGAEISNYNIDYWEALKVDERRMSWVATLLSGKHPTLTSLGQSNTRMEITGLRADTYYQVMVYAVNRMGLSDAATFVFRTGRGGPATAGSVGATGDAPTVRPIGFLGMSLVVVAIAARCC